MNNTELEELFVPYSESLELKELGFDGQCFGFYTDSKHYRRFVANSGNNSDVKSMFQEEAKKAPTALTYSQAFKFFRDKYNLLGNVYSNASGWSWEIHDNVGGTYRFESEYSGDCEESGMFTSFEKAELGCIKKLILIVK